MWKTGCINDKNALAAALGRGYWLEWFADGYADVHKPDGHIYQVRRWKCDCIAAGYDKTCKHVLWVGQLLGCCKCAEVSKYGELTTYTGAVVAVFACKCGFCRPYKPVVKNRKLARLVGVGFGVCTPGGGRVVAGSKALAALDRKGVA